MDSRLDEDVMASPDPGWLKSEGNRQSRFKVPSSKLPEPTNPPNPGTPEPLNLGTSERGRRATAFDRLTRRAARCYGELVRK
jgi:hypothetical protein